MATLSPTVSRSQEYQHNQYAQHSPQDPRPRATSALSYVSNKSRRSSGSGAKLDLVETSRDKKRLHTKADPNVAINDQQPSALALEASNLEDLRLIQHKDFEGNVIVDPDRSNPTRPRMERPLDTIRSFQRAAEGTSNGRRSTYSGRPASQIGYDNGQQSRRSSYFGAPNGNGYNNPQPRPRPGAGGYYRNQSYNFRPENYVEESPGSAQQFSPHNRLRNPSMPVGYPQQNGEGTSPSHSHQQSYETMTSGSDENGKSTNPSSQNSSFDQLHMLRKPFEDQAQGYNYDGQNGYNGNFSSVSPARTYGPYGGSPNSNGNYSNSNNNYQQQQVQQQQQQRGPMPPPKNGVTNNPRVPIKFNSSTQQQQDFEDDFKRSASQKRQSWFKRKFSKGDK